MLYTLLDTAIIYVNYSFLMNCRCKYWKCEIEKSGHCSINAKLQRQINVSNNTLTAFMLQRFKLKSNFGLDG